MLSPLPLVYVGAVLQHDDRRETGKETEARVTHGFGSSLSESEAIVGESRRAHTTDEKRGGVTRLLGFGETRWGYLYDSESKGEQYTLR